MGDENSIDAELAEAAAHAEEEERRPEHPHDMAQRGLRTPSPHEEKESGGRAVRADGIIAAFAAENEDEEREDESDARSLNTEYHTKHQAAAMELSHESEESRPTSNGKREKTSKQNPDSGVSPPRFPQVRASAIREHLRAMKNDGAKLSKGTSRSRLSADSDALPAPPARSPPGIIGGRAQAPEREQMQPQRAVQRTALRDRLRAMNAPKKKNGPFEKKKKKKKKK